MLQAAWWKLAGRPGQAALVAALALASGPTLAANEVVGKIEAKLDGKPTTWYVLRHTETDDVGVIWMSREGSAPRAIITGYESKDVEIGNNDQGVTTVTGEGSMLSLTFQFAADAASADYQLPGMEADSANVLFSPMLNDYRSLFFLTEGHVAVSKIELDGGAGASFAGSFSGKIQTKAGEAHELSDGRFDVSGGKHFQP